MKRKVPKLVVTTGISGSGRKEYLQRWIEYATKRGKRVKVFYVGQMMFEHARKVGFPLNETNILNADRDFIDLLRSAVFNQILSEISVLANDYDVFVLSIHAFFYWKKHYIGSLDKYLHEFSPEMYITFIDGHQNILGRLNKTDQWRNQNLNPEQTLEWQGVEVETTSLFANMTSQPFFVVPTTTSPSLFYRLIFHPEIEVVYSAMPISYFTKPQEREKIDEFVGRLEKYFVVFNPLSVEVVGGIDVGISKSKLNNQENRAIHHHITYRDLDWFVRRSDKVVAIWPEREPPPEVVALKDLASIWPRSVSSPGLNIEMHEAYIKTKDTWTVYLGKQVSPFTVHFSTGLFTSTKEFFDFLDQQYPDRKEMQW